MTKIRQGQVEGLTSDLAAKISDAPSDGQQYTRRDSAWTVASAVADGGFKGAWGIGTDYIAGDIVAHSGSTWGAETDPAVGDEPGVAASWVELAAAGGGGGGAAPSTGSMLVPIGGQTTRIMPPDASWYSIAGGGSFQNDAARLHDGRWGGTDRYVAGWNYSNPLEINLQQSYRLSHIQAWGYNGDDRAYYGIRVDVSTDGTTWETVHDIGQSNSWDSSGLWHIPLYGVEAQYVRWYTDGNTANTASHLDELAIYAHDWSTASSAPFSAYALGTPATDTNPRDSTSGSSYAAMTQTIAGARPCIINEIRWKIYAADDYTLVIDGTTIGTQTSAGNDTITFTGIDKFIGSTVTMSLTPVSAHQWDYQTEPGPRNLGFITLGDWQEASGNTAPVEIDYTPYDFTEVTMDVLVQEKTGLPQCRVAPDGTQTIPSSSFQPFPNVTWSTAEGDDWWSAGDPKFVTVPADGLYQIIVAHGYSNQGGANKDTILGIRINDDDASNSGAVILEDRRQSSYNYGFGVATSVNLTAGDKISVFCFQTSGSTLTISADRTSMLVVKIDEATGGISAGGSGGGSGGGYKGTWDIATQYVPGDTVSHASSTWGTVVAPPVGGEPGVDGSWVELAASSEPPAFDDLTDVDMTTFPPTAGQVPAYDQASGTWKPTSVGSGTGGAGYVYSATEPVAPSDGTVWIIKT